MLSSILPIPRKNLIAMISFGLHKKSCDLYKTNISIFQIKMGLSNSGTLSFQSGEKTWMSVFWPPLGVLVITKQYTLFSFSKFFKTLLGSLLVLCLTEYTFIASLLMLCLNGNPHTKSSAHELENHILNSSNLY